MIISLLFFQRNKFDLAEKLIGSALIRLAMIVLLFGLKGGEEKKRLILFYPLWGLKKKT